MKTLIYLDDTAILAKYEEPQHAATAARASQQIVLSSEVLLSAKSAPTPYALISSLGEAGETKAHLESELRIPALRLIGLAEALSEDSGDDLVRYLAVVVQMCIRRLAPPSACEELVMAVPICSPGVKARLEEAVGIVAGMQGIARVRLLDAHVCASVMCAEEFRSDAARNAHSAIVSVWHHGVSLQLLRGSEPACLRWIPLDLSAAREQSARPGFATVLSRAIPGGDGSYESDVALSEDPAGGAPQMARTPRCVDLGALCQGGGMDVLAATVESTLRTLEHANPFTAGVRTFALIGAPAVHHGLRSVLQGEGAAKREQNSGLRRFIRSNALEDPQSLNDRDPGMAITAVMEGMLRMEGPSQPAPDGRIRVVRLDGQPLGASVHAGVRLITAESLKMTVALGRTEEAVEIEIRRQLWDDEQVQLDYAEADDGSLRLLARRGRRIAPLTLSDEQKAAGRQLALESDGSCLLTVSDSHRAACALRREIRMLIEHGVHGHALPRSRGGGW